MEWSFPSPSKRVQLQVCATCPISLAYSPGCSLFRPFFDFGVGFPHLLSLVPVGCWGGSWGCSAPPEQPLVSQDHRLWCQQGLGCAWPVIQVSSAGSTRPLQTRNIWLLQPACSCLDELCREQLASAQGRNQLGALQCPP